MQFKSRRKTTAENEVGYTVLQSKDLAMPSSLGGVSIQVPSAKSNGRTSPKFTPHNVFKARKFTADMASLNQQLVNFNYEKRNKLPFLQTIHVKGHKLPAIQPRSTTVKREVPKKQQTSGNQTEFGSKDWSRENVATEAELAASNRVSNYFEMHSQGQETLNRSRMDTTNKVQSKFFETLFQNQMQVKHEDESPTYVEAASFDSQHINNIQKSTFARRTRKSNSRKSSPQSSPRVKKSSKSPRGHKKRKSTKRSQTGSLLSDMKDAANFMRKLTLKQDVPKDQRKRKFKKKGKMKGSPDLDDEREEIEYIAPSFIVKKQEPGKYSPSPKVFPSSQRASEIGYAYQFENNEETMEHLKSFQDTARQEKERGGTAGTVHKLQVDKITTQVTQQISPVSRVSPIGVPKTETLEVEFRHPSTLSGQGNYDLDSGTNEVTLQPISKQESQQIVIMPVKRNDLNQQLNIQTAKNQNNAMKKRESKMKYFSAQSQRMNSKQKEREASFQTMEQEMGVKTLKLPYHTTAQQQTLNIGVNQPIIISREHSKTQVDEDFAQLFDTARGIQLISSAHTSEKDTAKYTPNCSMYNYNMAVSPKDFETMKTDNAALLEKLKRDARRALIQNSDRYQTLEYLSQRRDLLLAKRKKKAQQRHFLKGYNSGSKFQLEWFGIERSDKKSHSSASVDSDEMLAYGKRYLWDMEAEQEENKRVERETFFKQRLKEMREKKFLNINICKYPQKQKGLVLAKPISPEKSVRQRSEVKTQQLPQRAQRIPPLFSEQTLKEERRKQSQQEKAIQMTTSRLMFTSRDISPNNLFNQANNTTDRKLNDFNDVLTIGIDQDRLTNAENSPDMKRESLREDSQITADPLQNLSQDQMDPQIQVQELQDIVKAKRQAMLGKEALEEENSRHNQYSIGPKIYSNFDSFMVSQRMSTMRHKSQDRGSQDYQKKQSPAAVSINVKGSGHNVTSPQTINTFKASRSKEESKVMTEEDEPMPSSFTPIHQRGTIVDEFNAQQQRQEKLFKTIQLMQQQLHERERIKRNSPRKSTEKSARAGRSVDTSNMDIPIGTQRSEFSSKIRNSFLHDYLKKSTDTNGTKGQSKETHSSVNKTSPRYHEQLQVKVLSIDLNNDDYSDKLTTERQYHQEQAKLMNAHHKKIKMPFNYSRQYQIYTAPGGARKSNNIMTTNTSQIASQTFAGRDEDGTRTGQIQEKGEISLGSQDGFQNRVIRHRVSKNMVNEVTSESKSLETKEGSTKQNKRVILKEIKDTEGQMNELKVTYQKNHQIMRQIKPRNQKAVTGRNTPQKGEFMQQEKLLQKKQDELFITMAESQRKNLLVQQQLKQRLELLKTTVQQTDKTEVFSVKSDEDVRSYDKSNNNTEIVRAHKPLIQQKKDISNRKNEKIQREATRQNRRIDLLQRLYDALAQVQVVRSRQGHHQDPHNLIASLSQFCQRSKLENRRESRATTAMQNQGTQAIEPIPTKTDYSARYDSVGQTSENQSQQVFKSQIQETQIDTGRLEYNDERERAKNSKFSQYSTLIHKDKEQHGSAQLTVKNVNDDLPVEELTPNSKDDLNHIQKTQALDSILMAVGSTQTQEAIEEMDQINNLVHQTEITKQIKYVLENRAPEIIRQILQDIGDAVDNLQTKQQQSGSKSPSRSPSPSKNMMEIIGAKVMLPKERPRIVNAEHLCKLKLIQHLEKSIFQNIVEPKLMVPKFTKKTPEPISVNQGSGITPRGDNDQVLPQLTEHSYEHHSSLMSPQAYFSSQIQTNQLNSRQVITIRKENLMDYDTQFSSPNDERRSKLNIQPEMQPDMNMVFTNSNTIAERSFDNTKNGHKQEPPIVPALDISSAKEHTPDLIKEVEDLQFVDDDLTEQMNDFIDNFLQHYSDLQNIEKMRCLLKQSEKQVQQLKSQRKNLKLIFDERHAYLYDRVLECLQNILLFDIEILLKKTECSRNETLVPQKFVRKEVKIKQEALNLNKIPQLNELKLEQKYKKRYKQNTDKHVENVANILGKQISEINKEFKDCQKQKVKRGLLLREDIEKSSGNPRKALEHVVSDEELLKNNLDSALKKLGGDEITVIEKAKLKKEFHGLRTTFLQRKFEKRIVTKLDRAIVKKTKKRMAQRKQDQKLQEVPEHNQEDSVHEDKVTFNDFKKLFA